MKKPLSIYILEYVATQPLQKFPIQEFTLPDAEGTSDELLQEIVRLHGAGLLDVAIRNDRMGRPALVAIRAITFLGKTYLDEWLAEAKTNHPLRKASDWTKNTLLVGIGMVLGGILPKFGEYLLSLGKKHLPLP